MYLTKASFSMITGAVINVLDYGAVGNGTANDGPAIQAAFNACPVGGTVYFPKGYYRSTQQLNTLNNISLLGEGVGSQLFMDGNNTLLYVANQREIRIEKLGFFSNNTNSANSCVHLYRVDASYFDFRALGGYTGLRMQGCLLNQVRYHCSTNVPDGAVNWIYSGWTLSSTQNGLYLETAFGSTDGNVATNVNTFINNVIEGVVYGVYIYGQNPASIGIGGIGEFDNQFIGGTSEGNGVGFYADGTYQSMLLDGLHFEANGQDISLVRCANVKIANAYIGSTASALQSVLFTDSANIIIENCYIRSLFVQSNCSNVRSYNSIIRIVGDDTTSSLYLNNQYIQLGTLPYGASDSYLYGQVQGQVQTLVNTNQNLQTWTVSTIPDGYVNVGSATIAQSTTYALGTYSAKVTAVTNSPFAYSGLAWPISTAYYGYWITVEVWTYSTVANNALVGVGSTGDWEIGSNATTKINGWVKHVVSFQADAAANKVIVFSGANASGANTPIYVGKFVIYSNYPN